mmetsp:Transcript_26581/g.83137  ORF Transcript_26581/g.83137 Transcript_26581/m.83137 type:complete len:211 (-) Transcript_26581:129-761(-)
MTFSRTTAHVAPMRPRSNCPEKARPRSRLSSRGTCRLLPLALLSPSPSLQSGAVALSRDLKSLAMVSFCRANSERPFSLSAASSPAVAASSSSSSSTRSARSSCPSASMDSCTPSRLCTDHPEIRTCWKRRRSAEDLSLMTPPSAARTSAATTFCFSASSAALSPTAEGLQDLDDGGGGAAAARRAAGAQQRLRQRLEQRHLALLGRELQ